MLLTVDASVVAMWFFEEPLTSHADKILHLPFQLNAPDLLVYEFSSIVRKNTRLRNITEAEGIESIIRFHALPFHFIPVNDLYEHAYRIANILDYHIYDCFYLAVPVQFGGMMITADKRFFNRVINSVYGDFITRIENPPILTG